MKKTTTTPKKQRGRPTGWTGNNFWPGHEVFLVRGKTKTKAVIKASYFDQKNKSTVYALVTPRTQKDLGIFERVKIEKA